MTATATEGAEELRRALADHLTSTGALRSPHWQRAFEAVPREVFVPAFTVRASDGLHTYHRGDDGWLTAVYTDDSLITQVDDTGTATSSSSQPTLMAHMLEALGLPDGGRVLEIGVGTGYNAALLCHHLGDHSVTSVDIDPQLVDAARGRLAEAGYAPTLLAGDGMLGHPGGAPYDGLLATCGVGRIPDAWRSQVRPGGVIVANVGLGIARLTIGGDGSAQGGFLATTGAFMRARPHASASRPHIAERAGELAAEVGETRDLELPANPDDEDVQFLGALLQPDVETLTMFDTDSGPVRYLVDRATSSWARLAGTRLDWGGPRDLWAEREPLIRHWVACGWPAPEQYGLRVAADGSHALLCGGREWPLP